MRYLIIGLGNPGFEYDGTRHNIGFTILDEIAKDSGVEFSVKRHAAITEVRYKGRILTLIKPNTFMNLSGKAVNYWMQNFKVNSENILIVTDDISLPFGIHRIRKKGSAGGHNGLKSISDHIGSEIFPRLRFGVGNDFRRGGQSEYVLSKFNNNEESILEERINLAINMITSFSTIGVDLTMSEFNGK